MIQLQSPPSGTRDHALPTSRVSSPGQRDRWFLMGSPGQDQQAATRPKMPLDIPYRVHSVQALFCRGLGIFVGIVVARGVAYRGLDDGRDCAKEDLLEEKRHQTCAYGGGGHSTSAASRVGCGLVFAPMTKA